MIMSVGQLRMPALDDLLRLAPVQPDAGLRVLELDTDPDTGASAAALATRTGGKVISLSQSTRTIGSARAAHAHDDRLEFRYQTLAAGWPPGAPYGLLLCWPLVDAVPHEWVVQCAPGGRLLCPVILHRPHGALAVLRLTAERSGGWQPPVVAAPGRGSRPGEITWSIRPARLELDGDRYRVSRIRSLHSA